MWDLDWLAGVSHFRRSARWKVLLDWAAAAHAFCGRLRHSKDTCLHSRGGDFVVRHIVHPATASSASAPCLSTHAEASLIAMAPAGRSKLCFTEFRKHRSTPPLPFSFTVPPSQGSVKVVSEVFLCPVKGVSSAARLAFLSMQMPSITFARQIHSSSSSSARSP